MRPSELDSLGFARLISTGDNADIIDLTNDSRKVKPGWLYAALPGERFDGHDFVSAAIDAGASAILCRDVPERLPEAVAVLQSDRPRLALSELAHRIHGKPSERLKVIGVTGTDGKTSTVYFVYQLVKMLGYRVGFLSSAARDDGTGEEANLLHQSTPEAPEVHRSLARMLEHGVEYAVVESTSHGLSSRTARLAHVAYHAAVLTNMSHEHLEFHGTFEQYRHDKANLFRALDHGGYAHAGAAADSDTEPAAAVANPGNAASLADVKDQRFAVANADDLTLPYFLRATGRPCLTYGLHDASITARSIELHAAGSRFEMHSIESAPIACNLQVPGLFSVYNALAATAVVAGVTGTPLELVARLLPDLQSVRGRMNVICSSPFTVIVDFAHTPGSFEAILPFFATQTKGKLIVVFGSAGDRDVQKRPVQGSIACEHADIVILANEDPRSEDPMTILDEIASGCGEADATRVERIPDRRLAIRRAISLAERGDTILLLGKGHETSIIGKEREEPWDEIEVAREELRQAGSEVP
jgi:UDP-N-acetylmuramoyl-L-alanyl-D-glutamate--2,6-diaminopimelate ligase